MTRDPFFSPSSRYPYAITIVYSTGASLSMTAFMYPFAAGGMASLAIAKFYSRNKKSTLMTIRAVAIIGVPARVPDSRQCLRKRHLCILILRPAACAKARDVITVIRLFAVELTNCKRYAYLQIDLKKSQKKFHVKFFRDKKIITN